MTEEQNQAAASQQSQQKAAVQQSKEPASQPLQEQVTYRPAEGDPPRTKWRGYEFSANVPVLVKDRHLIESARTNPCFQVGNTPPPANPNALPTDHLSYRSYAVEWLKNAGSSDELIKRWAQEANLREKCNVGYDDISYLGKIIEPKLDTLRRGEGLNDQQVAGLWIRHGILELPWRR